MKLFSVSALAVLVSAVSAFAADSSSVIHKYLDLAEELSVARTQSLVCDVGAYQSEILNLLEAAYTIDGFDPSQIGPVTRQELGQTLRFKTVTGEFKDWETKTPVQWTKVLANTEFNSAPRGAYGSLETLTLLENGVVKQELRYFDDNEEINTKISHGTWSVQVKKEFVSEGYRDVVRVALTLVGRDGKKKTRVFRLSYDYENSKTWILHTKSLKEDGRNDYNNIRFYNEIVDECEA